MTNIILIFVIPILTFVASEFFLPFVYSETTLGRRQRHFYSLLLSVFSVAMTVTITINLETRRSISRVEEMFTTISESPMNKHFQHIFSNYHKHFKQQNEPELLESWAHKAIESLSEDLQQASITLPWTDAKEKIDLLYASASSHIVATHIGSLEVLQNETYWNADKDARRRGIPIIRFYIFNGVRTKRATEDNKIIDVFVNEQGMTLEEYNESVAKLHGNMETLLSIVISSEQLPSGHGALGFLMVDGDFLAETDTNSRTTRATGRDTDLSDARSYFRELLGTTVNRMEFVHHMEDENVAAEFRHHFPERRLNVHGQIITVHNEPLAKTLARKLLTAKDA